VVIDVWLPRHSCWLSGTSSECCPSSLPTSPPSSLKLLDPMSDPKNVLECTGGSKVIRRCDYTDETVFRLLSFSLGAAWPSAFFLLELSPPRLLVSVCRPVFSSCRAVRSIVVVPPLLRGREGMGVDCTASLQGDAKSQTPSPGLPVPVRLQEWRHCRVHVIFILTFYRIYGVDGMTAPKSPGPVEHHG
jgi:hypothetical protein